MIPIISCIDLDNTFVYTTRDAERPLYRQLVRNPTTGSRTFMTQKQEALLNLFQQAGSVLPVTGRTWESVQRLGIPFSGYKICCHGGLILDPANKPLEAWLHLSSGPVQTVCLRSMESFWKTIIAEQALDVRVWIVSGAGREMYLSAKGAPASLKKLADALRDSGLLPDDYWIHHNHRNMAILPTWVRKEKALSWLREHFFSGEALWLGFGDSFSDLPFMQACDMWLAPSGSQIDEGARIWNMEVE